MALLLGNRRNDRQALRVLASRVQRECRRDLQFGVTFASTLSLAETDTDGWYVTLARINGQRGSELQLWLDNYPNAGVRQVSACLRTSQLAVVEAVAKIGAETLGSAWKIDDSIREKDRGGEIYRMRKRLPVANYGRPVAELYQDRNSWKFYTVFFNERVGTRPSANFKSKVTKAVTDVGRTAVALGQRATTYQEYPEQANREVVRVHQIRERSPKLALLAKVRDHFTCLICGINFAELYGEIGKGFVEAHHIVHLSAPEFRGATRVKDLRTVCANCHRMLHRVQSGPQGFTRVRRDFTGQWPNTK